MARQARTGGPGTVVRYPEPPSYLTRNFTLGTALKVFGPGAIIASITIGSGETVFASRGGAVFGYAILWTFIVGSVLKAALAYSANRYIAVTGEHPMTRWATLFPGPRGWFPLLIGAISILSFPSWAGGLATGIGDLMTLLTGFASGAVWATGLLLLAGALSWIGGYGWLEKAQIVIVALLLVALGVATLVAAPDWLATLGGLVPQVPAYDSWLQEGYPDIAGRSVWLEIATYLGAIGGGTYDYIGYTGMLREKRWGMLGHPDVGDLTEEFLTLPEDAQLPLSTDESEVRKARAWLRAPAGDVFISFFAIAVFAILFVVNGANILNADQVVPEGNDTLTYQADFVTAIHPALSYLYYVAIFMAFFGTMYGLWEVYSYTAYETLGAVFPKVRRAGQRSVRKWVYPYVFIGGVILAWTVGELVIIVTPASVLGGVLAGGLFCLAILWTERRMLPEPYRLNKTGFWYVLISGVALTILGVVSVLELFGAI